MPTTYQGFDVLEIEGDGRLARADAHERGMVAVGSPSGRRDVDDTAGVSELVREFQWTGLQLADVTALKAFMDARRGRAVPVWVASLEHDLELAVDHASAQAFLDVVTCGYAALLFPYSGARRHLSIRTLPGGAPIYRKVTAASNNLNGSESLSLDATLGADFARATTMVSFLRLCRLEEDSLSISWISRGYQSATLRFRELPHEASL
jgi:hypothetical protein